LGGLLSRDDPGSRLHGGGRCVACFARRADGRRPAMAGAGRRNRIRRAARERRGGGAEHAEPDLRGAQTVSRRRREAAQETERRVRALFDAAQHAHRARAESRDASGRGELDRARPRIRRPAALRPRKRPHRVRLRRVDRGISRGQTMTAERRERIAAFVVTALIFIAILLPELHYVPIWDGRVYANCAIEAATNGIAGLSMESLRCAGHPSQGYVVFLARSQLLRFGDIASLLLMNIALGLVARASIRVVLARVFPNPLIARQLGLVTLLCAVHPVVLSTLLQVNVDFGVYVFFFVALAALLSGRFGWTALAGIFLCFSKETGVLAYALMVGLDAVFRVAPPGTPAERVRRVLPMWVTAIPVALFGVHVVWWNATHAQTAVWKHAWQQGTMDGFRFFNLSEPILRSYAAGIF